MYLSSDICRNSTTSVPCAHRVLGIILLPCIYLRISPIFYIFIKFSLTKSSSNSPLLIMLELPDILCDVTCAASNNGSFVFHFNGAVISCPQNFEI